MASMIVVKLIGAIFKVPLANVLHETGMGFFNSAYTVYTAVYALTVTGLSAAVAKMVAENSTKSRYKDVRKILKLSTMVFVVTGIIGFFIIVFSARGFSNGINSPNSYWTVMMIAPAIFFCCIMASYRGYFEGLSNMTPTAITQIVEVMIKLVTGLLFANMVMSIASEQYAKTGMVFGVLVNSSDAAKAAALPFAAAGAMLGVTLSTLFGFIYIYLRYKIKGDYITKEMLLESPKAMRTKILLYRLIKISIPITLGAVVLQLSALIDTFTIMNRLAYSFEVDPELMLSSYGMYLKEGDYIVEFLYGCFTTAINLFNLVPAFTNIFGKSALPNVTSSWVKKDRKSIKVNIESVIRVTTLVAAPMAFGITFMSKPILTLLYPKLTGAINVGAPLLVILGLAAFCLSLVTPINAIFQGIGRMDLPVKFLLVGALLKFVLNVVLIGIPSINIMGGAYSTIVCYGVIAIISILTLRKTINVKIDFIGVLFKPILCGFLCGFSSFLSYNILSNISNSQIISIISIGIGAIIYVISLGVTRTLSKDDIYMLPNAKKIQKTLEKIKLIR